MHHTAWSTDLETSRIPGPAAPNARQLLAGHSEIPTHRPPSILLEEGGRKVGVWDGAESGGLLLIRLH